MGTTTLSDGTAVPKRWGVDLDQVRESGAVTYAANVAFPEGATIEVIGGETLDSTDACSLILLKMTGKVTGAPTVTGVTDPRWSATFADGTLRLKRFTGTALSFR